MPIFKRTNFIITASGIVTLCTVQYSMPDENRLQILLSSGILYSRLQRATIPDAVIIQFVLLKMGMLMLETCRGLFHQPTLMHNFLYSLTICLLHYYPRHVSSINMPIFRRKNCIHTASGILVYCADVYRERRYQMLCEYNFSS